MKVLKGSFIMNIVQPSMDELLPRVDSRYTLVVLAAKRARQILDGSDLKLSVASKKNVTQALAEIAAGKISYEKI